MLDDYMYILDNDVVHDLGNFISVPWNRYLTFLTFALNYKFGGVSSFGFHLVNFMIHTFSALSVYLLVFLTFKSQGMVVEGSGSGELEEPGGAGGAFARTLALLASLLFLAHPVQTQAVTYISQRFASLATMLFLLSLVFYVIARLEVVKERKAKGFFICAFIFALLAQTAKEISFTLPMIIILYEVTFFGFSGLRERSKNFLPFLLVSLVVPLTFLVPQFWSGASGVGSAGLVRSMQMEELRTLSSFNYLITEFRVVVEYIRLMVLPINQRIIYEIPLFKSLFDTPVLISFLFLSSLFVFAIVLLIRSAGRKSHSALLMSFGILWFFITLSVESSVIPIKDVIFEHRLYLPSVGFVIAFMGLVVNIIERAGGESKEGKTPLKVTVAALLVVVAVFSIATYKRNAVWRDAVAFWSNSVEGAPTSANARINLGVALVEAGRREEATAHYKQVVSAYPDNLLARRNLARTLQGLGKLDEAYGHFLKVIELDPFNKVSYFNIGVLLSDMGSLVEANKYYLKALEIDSRYSDALYNHGINYMRLGAYEDAALRFQEVLVNSPLNAWAHVNLATALYKLGRIDGAISHYRKALKLEPGSEIIKGNLEELLKKRKR
jgi:Flp pilus assembly protein TadD